MKIDLRRSPAVHVGVFIAHSVLALQLAEATGSNPVEAPKIFFFFFRATSYLLKLRSQLRRSIFISLICIPAVHIISSLQENYGPIQTWCSGTKMDIVHTVHASALN